MVLICSELLELLLGARYLVIFRIKVEGLLNFESERALAGYWNVGFFNRYKIWDLSNQHCGSHNHRLAEYRFLVKIGNYASA